MNIGRRLAAYFKNLPVNILKIIREPVLLSGIVLIMVFLFLFVLLPLLKIFQLSFIDNGHLSMKVFGDLIAETYNRAPFVNSIYRDQYHGRIHLCIRDYQSRFTLERFFQSRRYFSNCRPSVYDVAIDDFAIWQTRVYQ
jgi:ABC-type sugar transport system permease subunit